MEIIKRLILNKTPKDMPYGSMSCAKNMMVDDTGSFLTNESSLDATFTCNSGERIVGVIPCNDEIVIFTYKPAGDNTSAESHIYRKKDTGSPVEVGSNGHRVNWQYTPNTKITGSFTYNYKGELIIAFSEYTEDGSTNLPMKSLNLDNFDSVQSYAIEEEIPQYTSGSYIVTNGSLVCGVYTFFVRFKIDDVNYTKWFQVSGDINITQPALSKKYVHKYLSPYGNSNELQTATAGTFNVNTNKTSNKSVVVSLTFGTSKLKKLQLGYIIKRNSDVVGRLQGEYDIPTPREGESTTELKMSVSNNRYVEEISVDSFLENPHQFFNVKNIINYNNRLYIANYKEYPIVDHSTQALQTEISVAAPNRSNTRSGGTRTTTLTRSSNNNNIIWNLDLTILQHEYHDSTGWTKTNTLTFGNIVTDADGYLTDPRGFIDQISAILESKNAFGGSANPWGTSRLNYYWFLQKPNDNTVTGAICIASYINDSNRNPPPSWGWNFTIPDYKVKIYSTTETVNDEEVVTNHIDIEYDGSSWSLLADGPYTQEHGLNTGSGTKSTVLVFWHTGGAIENDHWQFGNCYDNESGPDWQAWNPGGEYMNHDIHISIANISNNAGQNGGGTDTPDPGSDDTTGGETGNDTSGANNRTLHPYQKYKFFIHYVRKDGSFTLGFPITNDEVSYALASGATVIIPRFKAVNPDVSQYVGYFISYEDVESTVDCVYITFNNSTDQLLAFTNAQYLYDLDTIRGTKIKIDGVDVTIDQTALSYINSRLTYNHLEYSGFSSSITNKVAYMLKEITNIYKNKVKTLYRLTKNIYTFGIDEGDSYLPNTYEHEYLPAFYTNEVIVQYTDTRFENTANGFIIDPTAGFVIGFNGVSGTDIGAPTVYNVKINVPSMYAHLPLSAMNIKQDFAQGAVSLKHYAYSTNDDNIVERTDSYINVLVSPDKLHDLLELAACYSAKPSKSFTNYNANNTFVFDKTIYRSNVISDESLINGFRHFDINDYKNILENKGKITNIVGIGLYFLVHTEYSLFVFDRSNRLSSRATVEIPDVFDVKYQDVMPSNEGFGGLANKEEAILTKNGYIWYDRVNKIIFRYENGKVTILSSDINNFLKYITITGIKFAEDIKNNRLLICINCLKFVNDRLNPVVPTNITISYSFNTNSFISLHDYKFTNNYRTYNKSYLFDENHPTKLFEFTNDSKVEYGDLAFEEDYFFPYYGVRQTDPSTVTGKSYVDVIFNNDYFTIKSLECIRYILNSIDTAITPYKITEEYLDRRFSGNEIRIYTDETDSGDLNITVDSAELNNPNNYNLPYFDKGCWNLNYFRNTILTPPTEQEVKNSLGPDVAYTDINKMLARSDNKSLIYGKYIVVRFIFNNDVNIKLDGLEIVTNKY